MWQEFPGAKHSGSHLCSNCRDYTAQSPWQIRELGWNLIIYRIIVTDMILQPPMSSVWMQLRLIDLISFLNLISRSRYLPCLVFSLISAGFPCEHFTFRFLSAYVPFIGLSGCHLLHLFINWLDMLVMLSCDSLSWVKSAVEPVWCELLILHRFFRACVATHFDTFSTFFIYCISHCGLEYHVQCLFSKSYWIKWAGTFCCLICCLLAGFPVPPKILSYFQMALCRATSETLGFWKHTGKCN